MGEWTLQWAVGGVNLGPDYDFFVLWQPNGASVLSSQVTSPNCGGSSPYGIVGQVKYQATTTFSGGTHNINSLSSNILFQPWEEAAEYTQYGVVWQYLNQPIDGGTSPWNPPGSPYATSTGVFYDVPVGLCYSSAYGTWYWADQQVYIRIGGWIFPIYLNHWTSTGSGIDHGTLTNGTGVSVSN